MVFQSCSDGSKGSFEQRLNNTSFNITLLGKGNACLFLHKEKNSANKTVKYYIVKHLQHMHYIYFFRLTSYLMQIHKTTFDVVNCHLVQFI